MDQFRFLFDHPAKLTQRQGAGTVPKVQFQTVLPVYTSTFGMKKGNGSFLVYQQLF